MNDAYEVVANDEDQHSIWPSNRTVPSGWYSMGVSGTKKQCLDYIRENWTDLRPKSVRRRSSSREMSA